MIGATETLTATVLPANTTYPTVTWTSSDTDVATVDDGVVTAVAVGTATITATCGSKSATCTVTVNPILANSVSLNKSTLTLTIGGTEQLTATVNPENTTEKTVTWSSSNTEVATVSATGIVTAIKDGAATITATCGSVSTTCVVTVNPIEATSVTLDMTTGTILAGNTVTLTATVLPGNTTYPTVTWTSSDTDVATVDDGVVTAVAAGTATITATCGSESAQCVVTVTNPVIEVTSVTLNQASICLAAGESETLTATVAPDDATDKSVTWSSSNEGVATVSQTGVVTAVSAGTATITVLTSNNLSATCTVTVIPVFAINDAEAYTNAEEKVCNITYTRNFTNTEWQPLFVPFSMNNAEWEEWAEVSEIYDVSYVDTNGNGLVDEDDATRIDFKKVTGGSLQPNTPYVIRAKEVGEVSKVFPDKTLYAATYGTGQVNCSSVRLNYVFQGVFETFGGAGQMLGKYAMTGGQFSYGTSAALTLKPQRFYLDISARDGGYGTAAAPSLAPMKVYISVDGEATAIDGLLEERADEGAYNLQGMRVGSGYKGIVIINGKKMLKK